MSDPWYDRETHTYYGERDGYGVESGNSMDPFIVFVGGIVLGVVVLSLFKRDIFTASERRAFKRAADVRDEVKKVQQQIADAPPPKPPAPDYGLTVSGLTIGLTTPKDAKPTDTKPEDTKPKT